ncbi:MAG: radical SAM protein [Bacteroidetes bacterium]|nr:radical SAM protein [Bacteroidota bacterium]
MLREKIVNSVLNKHKRRDSWFLDDYSVNAYEGCSCNCLYCYIRGSKYGENMEDRLTVKINAAGILEKQLHSRAKKNQYGIVAIGSGTDAYIKQDEQYGLTQQFLSLFLKYRFPVFISTKRTGIKKDLEFLKEIDQTAMLPDDLKGGLKHGSILSVSISSMDETVTNSLEPGTASPSERLLLVKELSEAGFLVGVNAIPSLPFISDTEEELEKTIKAAKDHKAHYVLVGGLPLFGNTASDNKTLYYHFLKRYKPELISKYNQLYGDKFYTPRSYQDQLKQRADKICLRYGIRNRIIE